MVPLAPAVGFFSATKRSAERAMGWAAAGGPAAHGQRRGATGTKAKRASFLADLAGEKGHLDVALQRDLAGLAVDLEGVGAQRAGGTVAGGLAVAPADALLECDVGAGGVQLVAIVGEPGDAAVERQPVLVHIDEAVDGGGVEPAAFLERQVGLDVLERGAVDAGAVLPGGVRRDEEGMA